MLLILTPEAADDIKRNMSTEDQVSVDDRITLKCVVQDLKNDIVNGNKENAHDNIVINSKENLFQEGSRANEDKRIPTPSEENSNDIQQEVQADTSKQNCALSSDTITHELQNKEEYKATDDNESYEVDHKVSKDDDNPNCLEKTILEEENIIQFKKTTSDETLYDNYIMEIGQNTFQDEENLPSNGKFNDHKISTTEEIASLKEDNSLPTGTLKSSDSLRGKDSLLNNDKKVDYTDVSKKMLENALSTNKDNITQRNECEPIESINKSEYFSPNNKEPVTKLMCETEEHLKNVEPSHDKIISNCVIECGDDSDLTPVASENTNTDNDCFSNTILVCDNVNEESENAEKIANKNENNVECNVMDWEDVTEREKIENITGTVTNPIDNDMGIGETKERGSDEVNNININTVKEINVSEAKEIVADRTNEINVEGEEMEIDEVGDVDTDEVKEVNTGEVKEINPDKEIGGDEVKEIKKVDNLIKELDTDKVKEILADKEIDEDDVKDVDVDEEKQKITVKMGLKDKMKEINTDKEIGDNEVKEINTDKEIGDNEMKEINIDKKIDDNDMKEINTDKEMDENEVKEMNTDKEIDEDEVKEINIDKEMDEDEVKKTDTDQEIDEDEGKEVGADEVKKNDAYKIKKIDEVKRADTNDETKGINAEEVKQIDIENTKEIGEDEVTALDTNIEKKIVNKSEGLLNQNDISIEGKQVLIKHKIPTVCKLSNTLNILSDDDDDDISKETIINFTTESSEKQCINIEDDDDIMLIDEDTNSNKECAGKIEIDSNNHITLSSTENKIKDSTESNNAVEPIKTTLIDEEVSTKPDNTVTDVIKPQISENEMETKNEKIENDKPLVSIDFLNSFQNNLADMTRDDLEEFCMFKIVESIVSRSNLNEIKTKLKAMAQNIEGYKKKAMMLTKQNRDLQVVLKSVQEEQKKMTKTPITPLKITRSVGMQVLMTDKSCPKKKASTGLLGPTNVSSNNNTRPVRNSVNQNTRLQKPNNNQIPVPRLVPAPNNTATKPITQANVNSPVKTSSPVSNGTRNSPSTQKVAEKRPYNKTQSNNVTVDLTDDDPPAKAPRSTTMAVRLVPPQNLMATQRQFNQPMNSPRKVYIPISGPQGQNIRPGQTILLKNVSPAPRQRAPTPQIVRMPQNVRVTRTPTGRHPAPLPDAMKQYQPPNWKALPPAPDLKLSKVENGIVISWKIEGYQEDSYEEIASYQLYAYQETAQPPNTNLWKKIGDVKALPLPMACTLTQFMAGYKYYFAVRAVDVRSRLGPFSLPGSILLLNKM